MKKIFALLTPLLAILVGLVVWNAHAHAAFNANDVLDDQVFDNRYSLTAAQIDSWLNTNFPNSCISTNHGFSAVDPTGYSSYYNAFYYSSSPVSAGQVIYDAAQAYQLNPQVLLTTLQKEQSLVSGSAGCDTLAYTGAMGYGCPDSGTIHNYYNVNPALYYINGSPVRTVTGTCVSLDVQAGFSQQVIRAAWLLAFDRHRSEGQINWAIVSGNWDNSNDLNATYTGPMTQGCFQRYSGDPNYPCPPGTPYDGYTTIDSTSVHMDTGATAALYHYTPHLSGNQSFDNIFTSWFGSIYAEPYNYSFVDSSTADILMEPGYQLTGRYIKIMNTGSHTWYADGSVPAGEHAVRLATRNYVNSPFADPSDTAWLGTKNQIKMTPATVAPGEVATFTFNLVGPNQLFSTPYTQYFVPVLDGSGFFYDKDMSWRISNRTGDYSFSSSQNFPTVLYPNQTVTSTVSLTNTGLATWYADGSVPAGGHAVRLAVAGYQNSPLANRGDPNWLGTANQVKMTPASVAPGQVATFTFNLYGPMSGMVSHLHFLPVLDGIGFMKDINLFSDITVPTPLTGYSFVSAINPPATMSAGSFANVSLTLRNTGSVVWTNVDSGVPNFRIMMTQPNYRSSAFYNSADTMWIAPSQIIYKGTQVGLNGTITLNFTWKAPAAAGTYVEHFAPVLDGYQVLQDKGMAFTVTVQ